MTTTTSFVSALKTKLRKCLCILHLHKWEGLEITYGCKSRDKKKVIDLDSIEYGYEHICYCPYCNAMYIRDVGWDKEGKNTYDKEYTVKGSPITGKEISEARTRMKDQKPVPGSGATSAVNFTSFLIFIIASIIISYFLI